MTASSVRIAHYIKFLYQLKSWPEMRYEKHSANGKGFWRHTRRCVNNKTHIGLPEFAEESQLIREVSGVMKV